MTSKTALIVNYKTTDLTSAAVMSVKKHSPDFRVVVYDNSNDYDGPADKIIQNRIDYDEFLSKFPNKRHCGSNYGSAKHTLAVDCCFDIFSEGFVLLDSDILVKKDLSDLWQPNKIWVGSISCSSKHPVNVPRLLPQCCYINTEMCRVNNIRYFNQKYMWALYPKSTLGTWYDTGAWFLNATKRFVHSEIKWKDYVIHLSTGSHSKSDSASHQEFLEKYKNLYI